ncbi:MAG: hypothetical protein U9R17_11275 [Thermodesulfobacteriota bacterium]|nr:hypothetical protein [Thermodesulfobacteriota bacterium]
MKLSCTTQNSLIISTNCRIHELSNNQAYRLEKDMLKSFRDYTEVELYKLSKK